MSEHFSLRKRLIALLAASAIFVTLPLSGCNLLDKDSSDTSKKDSETASGEETTKFGDNIVVKSKNYKVSYPVMEYLFNYMFQSYCSTYDPNSIGLDTSKDLKTQTYPYDTSMTWHDYFIGITKNSLTSILVFAEGAKANNLKLTEADESSLNSEFSLMEAKANESSMSLESYIAKTYGEDVTKADVEEIQRITILSRNYYNYLKENFKYTADNYEKEYKDNPNTYNKADFVMYSFPYTDSTSDEEKAKLKENAQALATSKNKKEFQTYVTKYLNDNPSIVSLPSSESSITEAEFKSAVDTAVNKTEYKAIPYNESTESLKWIFDKERKANDVLFIDEGSAYSAILVTKPLYRNENLTRNVRHILVSASAGSDEETIKKAKESAEKILAEWKSGEATEESFDELAKKYSEDPGSKSKGGLYKNVKTGQMVSEFEDWLFNKGRKVGDTGIVKTTYGYHIMFYSGEGLQEWQTAVDSALREKDAENKYNELAKDYKVEFDDDTIKKMTLKINKTETSVSD